MVGAWLYCLDRLLEFGKFELLPDGVPYDDEFLEQHAIAQKIDLSLAKPFSTDKMKSLDVNQEYNDDFTTTDYPTQPACYYPDLHRRMMRNKSNMDQ